MNLFHQQTGFFGEQLNRELYELAVSKNEVYSPSRTSQSGYYPDWRKSKVIYDSQFSFFKETIEQKIRGQLEEIRGILQVRPFEIGSFEVQLTSHNDGEYFKWHKDNSSPDTASRLITFVYYFHAIPRPFSGGELIIYDKDTAHGKDIEHVIEPANDSIVFFYSGRRHEVRPVVCPSRLFKDGRFTLNGWVRTKTSQLSQQVNNSYFGYNIFAPAGRSNNKGRNIHPINK